MLNLTRLGVTVGSAALLLLTGAAHTSAADGWRDVDCWQIPRPGCDLGAGSDGHGPAPGIPSPGSPRPPAQDGQGGGEQAPAPGGDGEDDGLAECEYVRSDYQSPPGAIPASVFPSASPTLPAVVPAAHRSRAAVSSRAPDSAVPVQDGEEPGAWYVWQCSTEGYRDALYRPPVWIPDGEEPGAELLPSPEELAALARDQLRLPQPSIATSPTGDQLVHLPTWLWLEETSWGARSATASVPGVSVTATARPVSTTWSTGDGASVTCTGPGTPFPADGDPEAPSPDCGHVYRSSSDHQPDREFPLTATVRWEITWSGGGAGGTFPDLTTEATTTVRVAESQALNTG
ncbi:hypothetical protein [Actinoalloteichus sp. GBA129-24]|uniref:hypothetical protein n=1 Tax=Actinoalloteichus sp. GBA129-24 TaxID=1612551 RepID=UPI000950A72D|nr:hypothetical protein [Actinoalloteichus sp. GBA129-24]APU21312.1 hypothetical protein UA75_16520 [Actinoalloteichus sp. GBA129-24]